MFSVKDAILTSESEIWGTSDFFAPPPKTSISRDMGSATLRSVDSKLQRI